MSNQHSLLVCTSCASIWKSGQRIGKSGGQAMLEQLSQLHQDWDLCHEFPVRSVECMSACSHACAVAFAGEGKHTYLFGDLSFEPDTFITTAIAILDCARKYYHADDGLLPWAERPEPLKKGVLARIPPLSAIGNS